MCFGNNVPQCKVICTLYCDFGIAVINSCTNNDGIFRSDSYLADSQSLFPGGWQDGATAVCVWVLGQKVSFLLFILHLPYWLFILLLSDAYCRQTSQAVQLWIFFLSNLATKLQKVICFYILIFVRLRLLIQEMPRQYQLGQLMDLKIQMVSRH